MTDNLNTVSVRLKVNRWLPGGGSVEVELCDTLTVNGDRDEQRAALEATLLADISGYLDTAYQQFADEPVEGLDYPAGTGGDDFGVHERWEEDSLDPAKRNEAAANGDFDKAVPKQGADGYLPSVPKAKDMQPGQWFIVKATGAQYTTFMSKSDNEIHKITFTYKVGNYEKNVDAVPFGFYWPEEKVRDYLGLAVGRTVKFKDKDVYLAVRVNDQTYGYEGITYHRTELANIGSTPEKAMLKPQFEPAGPDIGDGENMYI